MGLLLFITGVIGFYDSLGNTTTLFAVDIALNLEDNEENHNEIQKDLNPL